MDVYLYLFFGLWLCSSDVGTPLCTVGYAGTSGRQVPQDKLIYKLQNDLVKFWLFQLT